MPCLLQGHDEHPIVARASSAQRHNVHDMPLHDVLRCWGTETQLIRPRWRARIFREAHDAHQHVRGLSSF